MKMISTMPSKVLEWGKEQRGVREGGRVTVAMQWLGEEEALT